MRKVEHIDKQIRELSSSEFSLLSDWVLEQDWAAWDAQIERDSAAGKLDRLVSEAKKEFARGKARRL